MMSQEMNKLYEYVMNDRYTSLIKSENVDLKDTLFFFSLGSNGVDNYMFGYKFEITNPFVKIKVPYVGVEIKHREGYMFLAPEMNRGQIVISYINFGINYVGPQDTSFVNCGKVSYIFRYNPKNRVYDCVNKQ